MFSVLNQTDLLVVYYSERKKQYYVRNVLCIESEWSVCGVLNRKNNKLLEILAVHTILCVYSFQT